LRHLPRGAVICAALLLALFALLTLWEMSGDSLTSDERVHLPAGYAYWRTGSFRLNPEHPPLVKLLCAAPLLVLHPRLPPTDPPPGMTAHAYQPSFGSAFFFTQDADRLLFWGRLPVVALGLLLLVLIGLWSRQLHGGAGAGLQSLGLAALEPTLIAHSHYVTTDVAVACFGLMAMFFLWRFCRGGRWGDLLVATLGLGLALAAKFSAIFLAPIFFALLLARWPAVGPAGRPAPGRGAARVRLLAAAGVLLGAAVLVQATYFFSPDWGLYLRGIRAVQANHPVDYPAYVHGRFYIGGVAWYPLYAWLLKTPIPTLIAIAAGAWASLRRPQQRADTLLFLLLPAALLTGATCLLADNYGVRYLIPAQAFLLVLAGAAASLVSRRRAARAVAAVLGAWLLVSVLHAAPDHLSYFNELIGGPARGPWFLHDSNLDWGQDLKRLARYQRRRGIPRLVLAAWGPTPPDYYDIRYRPWSLAEAGADAPPPGVYAISVNVLVNMKKRVVLGGEDRRLDWLDRFRPDDRVGGSILIYRFPRPRAGAAFQPTRSAPYPFCS
jgi:Dolichyl-phosphate-mannose-protein mannosyltransferase